jgi:hypothetical protein
MRRVCVIAVAAGLLAAPAAPARAAGPGGSAVPVAGPTPSGAVVVVRDDGRPGRGGICIGVVFGAGPGGAGETNSCADVPHVDAYEPFALVTTQGDDSRRVLAAGGAVRAGVAEVELEFPGGLRRRVATTPGTAYRGRFAGRLAFFATDAPGDRGPYTVRMFDTTGRLVGETDEAGEEERPPLRGPVRLATGRTGAARWTLSATVEDDLQPTPIDPGRRVPRLCLRVRQAAPGGASSRSGTCWYERSGVVQPDYVSACDPGALYLLGFVRPTAARVQARLGSGRLLTARQVRIPAALGFDATAFFAPVPRREAVRSLLARARTGRVVWHTGAGLPPAVSACGFFGGLG